MSTQPKKRLGARIVRAFLVGNAVGFASGFGSYVLALAVNALTATTTLNPIAFLLVTYGFTLTASLGVEVSKDLAGE